MPIGVWDVMLVCSWARSCVGGPACARPCTLGHVCVCLSTAYALVVHVRSGGAWAHVCGRVSISQFRDRRNSEPTVKYLHHGTVTRKRFSVVWEQFHADRNVCPFARCRGLRTSLECRPPHCTCILVDYPASL